MQQKDEKRKDTNARRCAIVRGRTGGRRVEVCAALDARFEGPLVCVVEKLLQWDSRTDEGDDG